MDIKPIETIYNGYRFRSRLEARWAVFFDACNLRYQYEPEGFTLANGECYLPDFYLDDFGIYVEIKPFDKKIVSYIGDRNKWEEKCNQFRDASCNAILLCYGAPADDLDKLLFAYDLCDSGGGCSEWPCNFYNHNGDIVLATYPTHHDIFITDTFDSNPRIGEWGKFSLGTYFHPFYDWGGCDQLNTAKTKARQARFEHGETPRI